MRNREALMESIQGVIHSHSNGISGQPALVDTAMPTQEPAVDVGLQDLYKQALTVFNDGLPPEIDMPIRSRVSILLSS